MFSMRAVILGPSVVLALVLGLAAVGAAAQTGPQCIPGHLDNSALQAGAVSISPLPGSRDARAQTQISFLGVAAVQLSSISVHGSRSGAHAGRLVAYSQGDGASFLPARPFQEGERVTVRARLRAGGSSAPIIDSFAIATQDPITATPETIHAGSASDVQSFHSRPDLHPPTVTVTAQSPAVATGDVFVAPYTGPGQAGPMILDPSGAVVWFKALPSNTFATDLRVQQYLGQPVLTWWQGKISVHGFGLGEGVIADAGYTDIAHVRAGNGDQVDLHEFQVTPADTALVTAYDPIKCDLASVGGPTEGAVTDGVLQEIDIRTGLVRREWTSLDHVALSESYERPARSSPAMPFDFFHINSINLDPDGSLLVSARNTWTVYDLDGRSGQIAWRLGGRLSSFKAGPGTRMAFQHDPRMLPDGTISLFDNGASPAVHGQSRGIVLRLDPVSATATLVSQFTHMPPLIADSQGNAQALGNGDWFLGWGQLPDFSEFSATGALLFDAHFPAHTQSYRSFRFTWTGTPAHAPTYAYSAGQAGAATVYASWNGATQVASWRALTGRTPAAMAPAAQAARSGFETALTLPAGTRGPDVSVQALDTGGHILGSSAVATQLGLR
ncbi:MAG TPA: arylsulfotransferase family protein [Solirubrobacteraceae bacterium]